MISRGGLHCLPGNFDRDQNSLTLQPFRRQAALVICIGDAPGCRLEDDGPASEFVKGDHAAPFRRVPESSNRVCQCRENTPLRVLIAALERSKSFFHAEPAKSTCAISSRTMSGPTAARWSSIPLPLAMSLSRKPTKAPRQRRCAASTERAIRTILW